MLEIIAEQPVTSSVTRLIDEHAACLIRIAELEAALDEINGASFPMSKARDGSVQTMCVPIGAWENAMRFLVAGK